MIDFHGEPEFVNDTGVKWWRKAENVWLTEHPDGVRKFVVTDGGAVVYEADRLEDAGAHAHMLEVVKWHGDGEREDQS